MKKDYFLCFLQNLVNTKSDIDMFRKFIRSYISKFKNNVVRYEDLKNYFEEFIRAEMPSEADNILSKIEWDTWIYAPGLPPVENNFTNKYSAEVENMVNLFYENKLQENFAETFKKWFSLLKQNFLNKIKDSDKKLNEQNLKYLSNTLNLTRGYDAEVSTLYYLIVLQFDPELKDDFKEALIDFLGKYGRSKFLRPLYKAFYKRDKKLALNTLDKYRKFYHATALKYIELDLKVL